MATYEELSAKVDQSYTSCYCEENIWKLCEKINKSDKLEHLFRVLRFLHYQKQDTQSLKISKDDKGTEQNA